MVVLVTGSSRSLGADLIRLYASMGYDVIINYNNSKDEAYALQKEIAKYNVKSLVVKCDISKEDEVKKMMEDISLIFGKVDILINNASIAIDSLFEDKTVDNFRKILDTNLIGTFLVSKYIKNVMDEGQIINIASTNGIDTTYVESLDYDASKAGVINLTHNLAKVYAPNIRVNAVCPGWIDSDMNKDLDDYFKSSEINKILLNRFSSTKEMASDIYNISMCKYLNDAIIRIDGGERP